MSWGYQRGNQNPSIEEEHTMQCLEDTKEVIRIHLSKKNIQYNVLKISKGSSESIHRRRTYNTMSWRYQRSNQNPSIEEAHTILCLVDTTRVIRIRISKKNIQYNVLKIPKGSSESVYRRRTDNTMSWRYQRGHQNLDIEEEQTIQCLEDTKGVIRIWISKKDIQYNVLKISKG